MGDHPLMLLISTASDPLAPLRPLFERGGLHDLQLVQALTQAFTAQALGAQPGDDPGVVQPRGAGHAHAPLGADALPVSEGVDVLGPEVKDVRRFRRIAFKEEAEGGQRLFEVRFMATLFLLGLKVAPRQQAREVG